jgi:hypothetical protein
MMHTCPDIYVPVDQSAGLQERRPLAKYRTGDDPRGVQIGMLRHLRCRGRRGPCQAQRTVSGSNG